MVPTFERRLGRGRHLAGGGVTMADLFLAPVFVHFSGIPEFEAIGAAAPNCMRWAGRWAHGRASRQWSPR